MPPKINLPGPFPWAKGNGRLTAEAKGVVFGMHLKGASVAEIASRMDVTRQTVYTTIRAMEDLLVKKISETNPCSETDDQDDPPTRASSQAQLDGVGVHRHQLRQACDSQ